MTMTTTPGLRVVRTMCPMNCHPTLCGMLVEVEDGRLVGVRGDPDNPDSQGFLCVRGQASREIIGNPQRLLHPLVRARRGADAWRRATWDEALDLIAARMRAAGREAVGLWTGHGLVANNYGTRIVSATSLRRFANLWGCQWWSAHDDLLGPRRLRPRPHRRPRDEHQGGHGRARAAHPAVGRQPRLASRTPARHLAAARRRGAHVVTIDVRETEAAAQSDETLIVRPGTDAALALGDDARDRRRGAVRPRVRRAPHGRLRRAGRARARTTRPAWARRGHRRAGRADRRPRPPLRDDARRR